MNPELGNDSNTKARIEAFMAKHATVGEIDLGPE